MPEISNKLDFSEVFAKLQAVSETTWGSYQFQRDILKKKISPTQQQEMIAAAITCGQTEARKILAKYPELSMQERYQEMQIPIAYGDEENIGNRLLFALYDPNNGVFLMKNPIEKFAQAAANEGITADFVTDVLLAHELFHHVESHDETLYTQTERVQLWQVLFYKYRSNVRALSEIAAMAFAKELLGLDYSPYLYEIMMVWPYDEDQVRGHLLELEQIENAGA